MTSFTRTTISSSKRSIQFDFDTELFVSRIYQRWIRGSVRKSLHKQQSTIPYSSRPSSESKTIDCVLEEDARKLRRECKILMLGAESKQQIVQMMKLVYLNGDTRDELPSYRPVILKDVCSCAKMLVIAMRRLEVLQEADDICRHADFIAQYNPTLDELTDIGLGWEFKSALEAILQSPHYTAVMDRFTEFYLPDAAEHYFDEIDRIASPLYLPSERDVIRTRSTTKGIFETRFMMGQLSIHLIDPGTQRSDRKKFMHCFEGVTSIIFVVDLDTYNQVLLEESSQNRMMESLLLFDSVVNSRWFTRTSIILLLNNVGKFKQKLARSPLVNYFPDYAGGNDVNKAAKYILWRFNQVNRAHLSLYPHLVEPGDVTAMRLIFAAVKETVLNNALHDAKIFETWKDEGKI
ncbi:guanine nucleotide-binding protein alpha-3 subunit [Sarocladium strictum]